MWRGFFVSCRYSVSCWSESLRPNQVFHQKRNGIRQISQAVTKKRNFCVRDIPGFGFLSSSTVSELGIAPIFGTEVSVVSHRSATTHCPSRCREAALRYRLG